MTTLNFKPDPDNSWHRLIIFGIFYILILMMAFSCKPAKELSIEKEKEIVYIEKNTETKDSIINNLEADNFAKSEYITIIEKLLANRVEGTVGEKKKGKLIPRDIQTLTLKANNDSIYLEGDWVYFDYVWYQAPSQNIFKKEKDSISEVYKELDVKYKELVSEKDSLTSLVTTSISDKTNYRTNYRYLVICFVLGFASCFTILKWSSISSVLSWVKTLF